MGIHRLHWTPDGVMFKPEHFRAWLFTAEPGERVIYWSGHMRADQRRYPHLRELGDYAALMAELGAISLTQKRKDALVYQYFAVRSELRATSLPKAVSTGQIEVDVFRALRAVGDRDAGKSVTRAIRDALSASEDDSQAMLTRLIAEGWVTPGRPPTITEAGKAVLI